MRCIEWIETDINLGDVFINIVRQFFDDLYVLFMNITKENPQYF